MVGLERAGNQRERVRVDVAGSVQPEVHETLTGMLFDAAPHRARGKTARAAVLHVKLGHFYSLHCISEKCECINAQKMPMLLLSTLIFNKFLNHGYNAIGQDKFMPLTFQYMRF